VNDERVSYETYMIIKRAFWEENNKYKDPVARIVM
jgi:hypothetical protein